MNKNSIFPISDDFDDYPEISFMDMSRAVHRGHFVEQNKTSENFEAATVNFDLDVLNTFRATGTDWQHKMNVALKQWLQEHSLAHSV